MYSVIILTEAGKNIGFGHYTRCAALRDYLLQNNVRVCMLVFCHEITINDSNIVNYNWLKDIYRIPNTEEDAIVLVDSYLAHASLYTELRSQFKAVVAIDDYNRTTYDVDLVINPNVFFDTMDYSNQPARCIGGKDFVLLREAFRTCPAKQTNQMCKKILVTIGGTDYRNLLLLLVDLAQELANIQWTVIDPEYKLGTTFSKNITTKSTIGASEMAELMHHADIVISACGQTLHELVALQTPAIGICIDHDQVPNQEYYTNAGFLQHKNSWDDSDLKVKLISQLNNLSAYQLRQSISERCAGILNKNGVMNIAFNLTQNHD